MKLRVAVGVFHELERLIDAINGLIAEGFAESDLVVLCEPNALQGGLSQAFGQNSTSGAPSVRIIVRNEHNASVVDPLPTGENNWESSLNADQILRFETWIDAHFAHGLDHQLKRGGCLLLCPVLSPESEQSASNVLLRHSAGPVQLHDVRQETSD